MESAKIPIGSTIDERYQLMELLGEGGSGSTYKAMRLADGAIVAIKMLSLRHLNDWKQLELFEREAKVLSQLNHPQIPRYLEYFHVDTPENRAFYIVQQLAPGQPLTAWVQSGWRSTEANARNIATQLLGILQYLHRQSPQLIHRDLKPHNIIRDENGQIFLVDFGAVQNVYNNTLLKGSTVAGTYGYMAPEQFRGAAVPVSDLYGLGATILYLLTHRSPAELPQERLKLSFRTHVNISQHFADWLETILEPELAERFSSADTALSALQKQHQFRPKLTSTSFPWKGATIAAMALVILMPTIDRYRYTLTTRLGFPARDICDAIARKDLESVERYIDRGVSVNANAIITEGNDMSWQMLKTGSLLHCAIARQKVDVIEYLLDRGADPNAIDSDGSTPLQRLVELQELPSKNRDRIVSLLLAHKANINVKNSRGRSPLMVAIEKANLPIFNTLIEHGADPHLLDNDKSSLWHILVEHPRDNNFLKPIAEKLISAKVDINQPRNEGNTPLHIAVENFNPDTNDLAMIEILLKSKAKTNLKNNSDRTPLIIAISIQNFNIVSLLLSRGAEIDLPDKKGRTPLMFAIFNGGSHADDFTPQSFASPVVPPLNKMSTTPDIIALLVKKGANPNLVDFNGDTPFHLLGKLAEVTPTPGGCYQERSLAIYILGLLMRQKVVGKASLQENRQATNKDGDTALHVLAKQDFFPVTDRMIKYGWNPLQKNRQGKNALELIEAATPRSSKCQKVR